METTVTAELNTGVDHLKALEAESIFIFREAAAEFANPVMLYSIGKDSSVMAALWRQKGSLSQAKSRFLSCMWIPATNFPR